jgi:subfamily B ATP-binding cassette protein MsbA
MGLPPADGPLRGGGNANLIALRSQKRPKPKLRKVLPEVWKLVRPRVGILSVSFLLMVINRVCSFAIPVSARPFLNRVLMTDAARAQMGANGFAQRDHLLLRIILVIAGATLLQGITSFGLTQLLSKAGQRLIAELRMQVQRHIGNLSVSFYDRNRTGMLVARIMSDVEGVRNLVGTGLVDFIGGILTAVGAFVLLIRLNRPMTLLCFAIMAVFALIMRKAFRTIRPIFRERGRINAEVTGRLTESLGGVRVVKGYHAEENEAGVFAGGVQRLLENVFSSLTAQSLMSLSSTVAMGIVGGLVMYLGARENFRGRLDPGGYMEFTLLLAFLVAPMVQLVSIGTQLTEAFAGLDRTQEILAEMQEDANPARVCDLTAIRGDIRFEDVHFEYDPGKEVLHGISFHSAPGTVTALVGSSGSGKSTVISLVCAFHTATGGRVLVDDVDLAEVKLSSYREQLGVVLQESFLFDGTIRENVMFSRPGATREQVLEACRIARVDEFAERFPEGYDTVVGERGVKLSGGQRQRISIARAILANPKILILDEATSSLDSESEAMIQNGLAYLMQGRTTFVIAHRLSTIRRANQILVVEQGNIVERGTHAELFALRGRYYDLYMRQHGLEANLFLAPGEGDSVDDTEPTSAPVNSEA